jgi:hypothetical protein
MTSLTIISALLGVWLGLTFRVFILVPAAILALTTLAGSRAASEFGAMWMTILDISVIVGCRRVISAVAPSSWPRLASSHARVLRFLQPV